MKKIEWSDELPKCDVCDNDPDVGVVPLPAPFDVPTTMGPWANLCGVHLLTHGGSIEMGFERVSK